MYSQPLTDFQKVVVPGSGLQIFLEYEFTAVQTLKLQQFPKTSKSSAGGRSIHFRPATSGV